MNSSDNEKRQQNPKKTWEAPELVIRQIDEITEAAAAGAPDLATSS